MALTENKTESVTESKEKKYRYRVTPRYNAWIEEDKVIIQVALPGVLKKDIELKAMKDYFLLKAFRDDVLYHLSLDLSVDIEPKNTKTDYTEGLLRVELKRHDPLDDAFDVPIE